MSDAEKETVKTLLEWRDAAFRTCKHLGMYGDEMGAYLILCKWTGHIPEIGGVKRQDLLELVKA